VEERARLYYGSYRAQTKEVWLISLVRRHTHSQEHHNPISTFNRLDDPPDVPGDLRTLPHTTCKSCSNLPDAVAAVFDVRSNR
jgi:hypothetical protein